MDVQAERRVEQRHACEGTMNWVYCPHRGLGEKPSPSGEDFSKLAVWNITVDRATPFMI